MGHDDVAVEFAYGDCGCCALGWFCGGISENSFALLVCICLCYFLVISDSLRP